MARKVITDITEQQYEAAIKLLEGGGTKKAACEILNIAYNTKRLAELIEDFTHRREVNKKIRAAKRTQAVTKQELCNMIESYLSGDSFSDLSDSFHRSAGYIRLKLEQAGALMRAPHADYFNPPMLPDACVCEDFEIGELVWSTQYNTLAEVKAKVKNGYRVYILGEGVQQNAYLCPSEMGSIKHLIELGVNFTRFTSGFISREEAHMQCLRTANERKKKEKD